MVAIPAELDVTPKDPNWGECWSTDGPEYVTPDGIAVWMWRNGQKVRFYDARATQVGPEHRNVYPAQIWAAFNAWISPTSPNLSLACITEVRRQVAERTSERLESAEKRAALAEVRDGAFDPRVAS